jgi:hypothetical protein
MSLYGLVFGQNPDADAWYDLLQSVQPFDSGRFRDIWVERDGDSPVIRLHTRNGGGNREDYEDAIESMRAHPWFVRDVDDDFDPTYADFYFRPDPAQIDQPTMMALVQAAGDPVDMDAAWQAVIDAIRGGGH